jgi:mercuric transport protein
MKAHWSLSAALTAAGLSAACCTIPLALVSLGVGGAWMGSLTALAPYRWVFVTLAVGALGYAGYREWRRSRQPDCDCDGALSRGLRRSLLGLGAGAVLVLVGSPWLFSAASGEQAPAAPPAEGASQAAEASPSRRKVVLTVDGMTCASCRTTVRAALESVDGVHNARVTYDPPEAVVRFDSTTISVKALTQATERARYPSHRKSP